MYWLIQKQTATPPISPTAPSTPSTPCDGSTTSASSRMMPAAKKRMASVIGVICSRNRSHDDPVPVHFAHGELRPGRHVPAVADDGGNSTVVRVRKFRGPTRLQITDRAP